jgi:hypothetical protein
MTPSWRSHTKLQQHDSASHGTRSHVLAMNDPFTNNKTCDVGRDDIWGTGRPRDVRLQLYISLTLGVLAFLTFCASLGAEDTTRHR